MKKIIVVVAIVAPFLCYSQNLKDLKNKAEQKVAQPDSKTNFTEEEAAKALREALKQGAEKGAALVSKTDGYFGNPKIKIPFPPDAKKVEDKFVGFWRIPSDAPYWGLKPNLLGDNLQMIPFPER